MADTSAEMLVTPGMDTATLTAPTGTDMEPTATELTATATLLRTRRATRCRPDPQPWPRTSRRRTRTSRRRLLRVLPLTATATAKSTRLPREPVRLQLLLLPLCLRTRREVVVCRDEAFTSLLLAWALSSTEG